ncbi:MAG: hypothetical protein PHR66_01540 [Desulfuromonadaceae bacterium]|nr:hypothetical protein [Desulfuromonadaceae bacterium]
MNVRRLTYTLMYFSVISLGWTNPSFAGTILFQERFEDVNMSSREWYDNTNPILSSLEHVANSTKSVEFHFSKGAVLPNNGSTMRKKILDTDSVYISYYVKYSSSWVGSGVSYHPHEFYLLTNKDTDWIGPAYTHLTVYLEENAGKPLIAIQDGVNIDTANIGKDLTTITEKRGVAGCNGDSDGYGNGDCYANGGAYWNGKIWKASSVIFSNVTGPNYKSEWHLIEAYVKLNSIANSKAVKDGIIQYWFDGSPVLDYKNVVFRTAINPDMKFNQFIIGPYIGVGSPVDQTFWVDNLVVATDRTTNTQPSSPQNLRIVTVK